MANSEHIILNAESNNYSREARKLLEQLAPVVLADHNQDSIIKDLPKAKVLIVRLGIEVNAALMDQAPHLEAIVSATTGTDHIDLQAAADRNIEVLTLKGEFDFLASIPSTAEHTWALLLSVVRRIPWAHQHALNQEWDREQFKGHNVQGKSLGILGLGRVGKQVARFAQAFGMKVYFFDTDAQATHEGAQVVSSLQQLLEQSQILCIHIPLNDENHQLLDQELLSNLPLGAVVVNTSRGGIWDEQAVYNLLEQGHLAAVATDVLQGERGDLSNHPLIKYARNNHNLLITPHIAGATFESMEATEIFMAKKILKFFNITL